MLTCTPPGGHRFVPTLCRKRPFSHLFPGSIFEWIFEGFWTKMAPKDVPADPPESILFATFFGYRFLDAFWSHFGSLLGPFWLYFAPFGLLLDPFGSILDPFGSILVPFGSILAVLAPFSIFGLQFCGFWYNLAPSNPPILLQNHLCWHPNPQSTRRLPFAPPAKENLGMNPDFPWARSGILL